MERQSKKTSKKVTYKNKKITICGLGTFENGSGISTVIFLAEKGADLLITDLKTEKELARQIKRLKKYKNIKYVLGRHRKKDFENVDFIFRNPGVSKDSPYLKIAREKNIPIINDWSIFLESHPDNLIIGVTGTKGKSVTAALIYEVLKKAKKSVVFCGNIGQSPLAVLDKIKKNTVVIAEFSSWLLSDLKKSPQIAVITNLMPDHLDKYKNIEEYYSDKMNIFRFQGPGDHLIQNKQGKEAALEVAKILKIPETTVSRVLKTFGGVPGRLEFIGEKGGIKCYNDTCATTPDATIYALKHLKEYKEKIVLIAGGVDKELDYKKLAQEIPKYCKALILFQGTASDKIIRELKIKNCKLKIKTGVSSMKSVADIAHKFTEKDDIILLSPAAASFNFFKNEFDRGRQFIKAIK